MSRIGVRAKAKRTATRSKAPTKRKGTTRTAKPAARTAKASKAAPRSRTKPARGTSAGSSERYGGIGDAAVLAKTGKSWREWFAILDRAKAHEWVHREIAAFLHEKQGVGAWWRQMVTVGYEQARGLRVPNQKSDGFAASASKTVAVPVARLYDAWADESARRAWLGPAKLVVRNATRPKSMRIAWPGGSSVAVMFLSKTPAKSLVCVEHEKLDSTADVAKMKTMWRAALEKLAARLAD